jgi:outer membrane protein assembly factor BamB
MRSVAIPTRQLAFATAAILLIGAGVGRGGDWPGWRGPTGLGYTDEKDLPLTWNGKTGQNVLWKTPLEGGGPKADFTQPGHSCPIVCKDRVFVTTAVWPPEMTDQKARRLVIPAQHVLCFRTSDGKQLWDTLVPPGKTVNTNVYHGYSVPTPCTDGKLVYTLFGSGVLAALDFDGKIVWREELPGLKEVDQQGFGTSPVLYQDLLIIPGFGKSGLRALDKNTGTPKWETPARDRNVMPTPALIKIGGRTELIHYAGGVQGLDPATGEVLWFCRGPAVSWASPAFGRGLLYVDEGRGNRPGSAVDPTGTGDVSKTHMKWQNKIKGWAGTSAIIVGDYVYRVSDPGILHCLKLDTGEPVYEERLLKISPSASPIATPDGRIYFASAGRTYVIKAGPSFEVLATNDLETSGNGHDYPTPAVSGGRIYFKSRYNLWCVGKKEP